MSSVLVHNSLEAADTTFSGVTEAMEDTLLLHVCECSVCLAAALGRRERLIDKGCVTFRQLAERMAASVAVQDSISLAEGHLPEDVIEEYCFKRLSPAKQARVNRHLAVCERCTDVLYSHRQFLSCLKDALASSPSLHAKTPERSATVLPRLTAVPKFSSDAIAAARKHLPVSQLAGLKALQVLQNENASLAEVARTLKVDPVISAHLIRVANSALLSFGHETRSVEQAVARIGLQRTKLHVWGLSAKRMFLTPQLQKIWNHSILAAQIARQISEMTGVIPADEACLVALVHDIGQIVFAGLGPSYERAYAQRLAQGMHGNQIEQELCGMTHAQVGADLLASWDFPADLVSAVRFHHAPLKCNSPFAPLLYIAESWLTDQEDGCDLPLHGACMRKLGLTSADAAQLGVKHSPDLEMLRFAA